VRRWEFDAPPWPHPDRQAAVEALFQRPITELGFTPPWVGAESDSSQPEGGPVSAAVTANSAVGSLAMFPQRQPSAPLPGSVVTDYIAVTTAHRHIHWAVPSAHLHDVVAAHVNLGARLVPPSGK
jgi:hypothetical protein